MTDSLPEVRAYLKKGELVVPAGFHDHAETLRKIAHDPWFALNMPNSAQDLLTIADDIDPELA